MFAISIDRRAATPRSISDDDVCSDCAHCDYRAGERSTCNQGWPGQSDAGEYVTECDEHVPAEASTTDGRDA